MDDEKPKGLNPKDLIGASKPDLALVSSVAIAHCAMAMMDGARKYGPYNWREPGKPVQSMTYISAALRHLRAFLDGEEFAEDSGVHHLGHAMSCCAILLDAQYGGFMVDNRPNAGTFSQEIKKLTKSNEK